MKYRVIEYFVDLQDNNHKYERGDSFPRAGLKVSDQRIAELSGKENRRKMPLIEKVIEKVVEKVEKTEEPVAKAATKPKTQKKKKQ